MPVMTDHLLHHRLHHHRLLRPAKPAALHLETLRDRNIAITTRLVDTTTIPMLLKTVGSNKIDPILLITHLFTLDDGEKAYATFGNTTETKTLKVIITM